MMRILLDSNVLVSGFRGLGERQSPPTRIILAWLGGAYLLLTSEHIVTEVRRAMSKPYFLQTVGPERTTIALGELGKRAEKVEVIPPVPKIATHWHDDLVLAAAKAGAADYLVTGDNELLALGTYGGTSIVSVDDFVAILDASNAED